ncbi:hypothetical protein GF323_01365 [Candidatus Woesearchaeota archaeon]|nr:hypothetical protein [Candidatus Woesearchaeota archaeon]
MAFEKQVAYMLMDADYHGGGIRGRHSAHDLSRYMIHEHTAERWLKEINKSHHIPKDKWQEIGATLTELMINSRSACCESKELYIDYQICPGFSGTVIRVEDDGSGYDYKHEIEKTRAIMHTLDEKAILEHEGSPPGRGGTFCLLNYANRFAHNEKGNAVAALFLYSNS